ncbi:VOC family protein [Pontimicrobium sp. IMCC45349]|uniref:VOC family protein n=1 Tax=Pontimicrobium sp. IMCC45349 TaxID=3391574 RepID=UPI0039A0C72E
MKPFNINFLDHVAIYVKDMEVSINWYAKVLGLKKYQLEKWGAFPVFMMTNKTGVAIFPANLNHDKINPESRNVRIEHFAFNVTNDDFIKAQNHFKSLNIPFEFQDHHYFHSIYVRDPDNHKVELTTIMVDENSFY